MMKENETMKKNYDSPKAEKMEFNYSETVVASYGIKCTNETTYTENNSQGEYCQSKILHHVVADVMP